MSLTIPLMELHMGGEPVAVMIQPTGQVSFWKIKPRGRYFTMNTSKIRGIYAVNNKYRLAYGKTPLYFFVTQTMNQVDPILIDKINKYTRANQLTELKRKDVHHGRMLRVFRKRMTAKESNFIIEEKEKLAQQELDSHIEGVKDAMDKRVQELEQKHGKTVVPKEAEKSYVLLNHLHKEKMIDDVKFADFTNKTAQNELTFDQLIDELRELHVVTVSEPLDLNVEDFIQDLGSQNAADLAGFVQDLRQSKKGLKDMTPAPVKSFMSAGILFAIILGALIGIPVIIGQLPAMQKSLGGGGGGEAGFKMPWDVLSGHAWQWLAAHAHQLGVLN